MKTKYQIVLNEKNRFGIFKEFETLFAEKNTNMKFKFRKLVNIEDKDEK